MFRPNRSPRKGIFYKEYKIIALVALVCFLVAAITFTISKIRTNALEPLNQKFVEAGAPEASYFQTLGDFLYNGVDKRGFEIYVLFNNLGFLLTSYLLYISRSIPRAISVWGIAAVLLSLIPAVLTLYDRELLPGLMILYLSYAPKGLIIEYPVNFSTPYFACDNYSV